VFVLVALGAVALQLAPSSRAPLSPEQVSRLQELRNLGKAFYENPGTQNEAVEALRQALELNPGSAQEHLNLGLALLRAGEGQAGIAQIERAKELDPALPHSYFNLGIEFKRSGDIDRAISEFEQMARLTPGEAKAHYNLGQLYRLKDNNVAALERFRLAARLDPALAAAPFQMYNILRRNDPEAAKQAMADFQRLKAAQEGAAVPEDVEWSFYSELYDPKEAGPPAALAARTEFRSQAVSFGVGGGSSGGFGSGFSGLPIGMALLDAGGARRPDLLVWSAETAVLFSYGQAGLRPASDLAPVEQAGIRDLAPGDYNNDGFPDLAWVRGDGVSLAVNRNGSFTPGAPVIRGDFQKALWVDYDHDYDLDLLAIGADKALLRNNGDGTFLDVSGQFPFEVGSPAVAAAAAELLEDNTFDIVIAYADKVVHYDDRKMGVFEPRTIEGANTASQGVRLDVVDYNNDGLLDVALTAAGSGTQILVNHEGTLRAGAAGNDTVLAWADLQNRGWLDAMAAGKVLINHGTSGLARGSFAAARLEPGEVSGLPADAARAVSADFDGDGRIDLAVLDSMGGLHLLTNATETGSNVTGSTAAGSTANTTATGNRYVTITLEGVKSAKLAEGSRVEIRAGQVYSKKVYRGLPLHFGLGGAESLDTVRITWPNGLIQNETQQPAGTTHHFVEKPRLSGSCPMIYTWNGSEFEFISEVLGVAPLGAGLGEGKFFPVDHDEYVWIDGVQLRPQDGFYEVRITEELREVAYLDQVKLIAVDHPDDLEIHSNEKFKFPPFPEFRLYGVSRRVHPNEAVDHRGGDVRDRILATDQRYADGFWRDFAGRAETHSITLDFASLAGSDDIVLFLRGWVDWADASTITAAGQNARDAFFGPYLEAEDAQGNWVKIVADVGLPAGRPRTIAVDLTGKFPARPRRVRITTNMSVYWDEIFAATGTSSPKASLSELLPSESELRFRGFSEVEIHPERKQPELFHYAKLRPASMWNPTPGRYTRFGEVRELLTAIDDRFVILGAGDELALRFPAAGLPPLASGWTRDFLLFVDGWAKEQEANTAFGDSVEPLPFHAMPAYPYGPREQYPLAPPNEAYVREYNTRPALRLIRPLQAR
jgi:tetratricopeptide (TPR) repeat protein